ncbi:MAG TPA: hypothetical protein VNY51_10140 [Candidatus Dormibacteraeota bacterium]|jgi:hypothetical protein|nr:hypothetical protein [Candidatus Dormibacteraeota bacterium]
MAKSSAATSGTTYPSFVNPGAACLIGNIRDAGASWQCLGVTQPYTFPGPETNVAVYPWPKNSQIRFYGGRTSSGPLSFYEAATVYPLVPFVTNVGGSTTLCNGQATYLLGATSGSGGNAGTTANTTYTPWSGVSSQSIGDITTDNDLQWLCLGSATWAASTAYEAWTLGESTFSVIEDSNSNMQVCITSGTSAGSAPTWGTGYGQQTADGSVTWVCVGPSMSWTANTNWYLPINGFFPPEASQPYGGAQIVEGGFVQAVVQSGLSGSSAPSWTNTIGGNTTDNAAQWLCIAQSTTNSLTWTKGHVYAYSYKCRTSDDFYVTNVPPGRSTVNGPYKGGGTGAISTASPAFTITGGNQGAVNLVQGEGSTDPQVDTVVIWRDADGGGVDNMFELTEIPAPPPKGGVAQPWQFQDYLPDVPTGTFPGLDNLIPAPIDDANDPPPVGFLPMAWHFQRIWGGLDTNVFNSGGPDVITGNPNEAFNPADEFPFLSTVTDCVHTPSGLVVILQTDIEAIYGGPTTASFFSTTLCPGKGALSYNAIDFIGGEIYIFTSDSQCIQITPSLQVTRIGFPIGDKLAAFDAADVYLTVHDDGVDNAVYVGDGSTGYYRLNPHQVPQGDAIWSPFRTITGGCKMLQSVTTAPGVTELLIGGTGNNQSILKRDMTTWDDNGTAYDAWIDIGAITLCDPGQIAKCKFIEIDYAGVGNIPNVYVALDDPTESPTWTQLTTQAYDPPQVYGQTVTPPYYPRRYYFDPNLSKCRRIRIKVDFGSAQIGSPPASVPNELYSFAVFGKLEQES